MCDGKLAVLDISESGRQIGEKLFALLDPKRQNDLKQYLLSQNTGKINPANVPCPTLQSIDMNDSLTEIEQGALYFCLEQRLVTVCGEAIELTTKEFDLLALLISNPKRVFTYEMIADIVWDEPYDIFIRKTITNHVSSLRRKLQITPEVPNYIKSIHNVGYRFDGTPK